MTEQKVDLGSALYVGTKVHYLIYQITNFVLRQNCPANLELSFIEFRKLSKRNKMWIYHEW